MTIKDSELRLGNLFKDEISGDVFPVLEIRKDAIVFDYVNYGRWQAKPIPLTEDWLLKCGFVKHTYSGGNSFIIGGFELSKGNNWSHFEYLTVGRNEDGINEPQVTVKYVHQLQNLYFALTGAELTITL